MRRIIACSFALMLMAMTLPSFGAPQDELKKLLTEMDDPYMTPMDLAFFLETHDYAATPEGDHVMVHINGLTLRLVPNGSAPGLADIEV